MNVTREQLLSPRDPPQETVPLPELGNGACVIVRGFSVSQRLRFEQSIRGTNGKTVDGVKERLVVACCRDESGAPLFRPEDVTALAQQPSVIVERIVSVAMRLSGIGEVDIPDLKKNSEATSDGEPLSD